MPIQQNLISNSKTLRGIPRGIGPIEVVIGFRDDDSTNESKENKLDDVQYRRPNDHTVAWYHSLGETEKQIKGLQLHETWNHPPFVVLSMNDNSFLLFELTPTAGDPSGDFKSINVTRLTNSNAQNLPPSTIRADFSPTPEDGKAWVDLKFAIAICYGFLDCISSSSGPYSAPVCQRLFALAFFVSVVRQRLPIDRSLIKDISTVTAVDNIYGEVLSREHAGQLLWVTTIAEEVHQVVSQGIHEAAVDSLKRSIPATILQQNAANDKGVDERNARIATLVAAWLGSMVNKGKSSVSNLWDKEWDQHWSSEWKKNWVENWSAAHEQAFFVRHFIDQAKFSHKVPATSALSGSAAGRATIEVALVTSIIPTGRLPTTEIPDSQTKGPSQTPPSIQLASPAGEGEKRIPSSILSNDTPTPILAKLADERNRFDFWHSVRRPDLKKRGEWLPTWEAANNMAWVLGWENDSKKDEKSSAPPSGTRAKIRSQGTYLHPGSNSKARSSISDLPAFQGLGRLFSGWLNWSRAEIDNHDEGNIKLDLQKLSEVVWVEAHNSDPDVDAYTKENGEAVHELLKEEMESSVSGMALPSEEECVTVFKNTLKQTWQKCWERAWEKVMNDTLKELNTWKHTTNDNVKNTSLANIEISELNSYSDLCRYMKSGNLEESHWTIRSAFKASTILYRVLEHSVPRCYEGGMTILYFPDRAQPYDIPSLNSTSKFIGITKVIRQDREQLLTYKELEERIKHLASMNRSRVLRFSENYNAAENLERIWKIANSVDSRPEFIGSKDTMQPWLR
ncbi:hypothetical protein FRC11_014663, partial [Ceratobasidium sp. 423]